MNIWATCKWFVDQFITTATILSVSAPIVFIKKNKTISLAVTPFVSNNANPKRHILSSYPWTLLQWSVEESWPPKLLLSMKEFGTERPDQWSFVCVSVVSVWETMSLLYCVIPLSSWWPWLRLNYLVDWG